MKTWLAAFVLAFACSTSNTFGSIQVGDVVYLTRGPGQVGGVFNVTDLTAPSESFGTFCVEITETIHLGSNYRYYVYDVSQSNHANGSGKPVLPLGSFAAWLYTQFRDSSSAYHIPIAANDPAKNQKANALQLGIWRSMGYTDSEIDQVVNWNFASLDLYLADWSIDYLNDSSWPKTGDYTGRVAIMSLATALNADGTPRAGSLAQDQLVWTHTPEPGALLVWAGLMGAAGAIVVSHRSKS
jgi:hypothetical protein